MPEKHDPVFGPAMEVTNDHLLDGRIRYGQPAHGFRSGIEPVILAAAIPLRPGDRILEAGSGAGAALLCAAARVANIIGVGIELDTELACLAQANARANDRANVLYVAADVLALPVGGRFDHACANPPYHAPGGTRSPVPRRDRAKRSQDGIPNGRPNGMPDGMPTGMPNRMPSGMLSSWACALAAPLRHRGTLTFILPTAMLGLCMRAMEDAGCRVDAVFPLWPKAGRSAKLMLVQAIKGGRGSPRLLPGLVLHQPDGRFTEAAAAILRKGDAISLS